MSKYLIACDSFKECLSSSAVADALEKGLLEADPTCTVVKLHVADGGEGTVEALRKASSHRTGFWRERSVEVSDPLGRPVKASYGIVGGRAMIETASACGLALLKPDERNPLLTSSYGLGQMISDALSQGCRQILVGLGGSATNDAGTGMLEALGYRFRDAGGNIVHVTGSALSSIISIDDSQVCPEVRQARFTIACDVDNPLYGPDGAAYVFAPQKGADEEMVRVLDHGLRHFAVILGSYRASIGKDGSVQEMRGSGAAGGLGAAFMAVLGATARRGIDLVLDEADFDTLLDDVTMVITGEGHIDSQTLSGKVPFGVLSRCKGSGIPVVGVCGRLDEEQTLRAAGFADLLQISDPAAPLSVQMDPDLTAQRLASRIRSYILS